MIAPPARRRGPSRSRFGARPPAGAGGRMTGRRTLPALAVALAIVVWAIPLQLGVYADSVISDIPVYQRAYDAIAGGGIPYVNFSFEYPPLAAVGSSGWPAPCPGPTGSRSRCLCARPSAPPSSGSSRWPAPSGSTAAARPSPRASSP